MTLANKENQTKVVQDELVGAIHDRILDNNNLNLADAYNQACVEIADLYRGMELLEKASSSGFIRIKRKS